MKSLQILEGAVEIKVLMFKWKRINVDELGDELVL